MWKIQNNARGENADEVVKLAGIGSRRITQPKRQWDQVRDGWIRTGSSKLREWDVEEDVQGFPHSLEEGAEYDNSRK